MPSLNILTWSCGGESLAKATYLARVIDDLIETHGFTPEVIVIQRAARAKGPIHDYLDSSLLFQSPVAKASEGRERDAYLMAAAPHVAIKHALQAYALSGDSSVNQWIQTAKGPQQRELMARSVAGFPALGIAEFLVDGATTRLATWHAPRGESAISTTPKVLPGGGNPDAFLALQASAVYQWLIRLGRMQAGLFAGSLNLNLSAIGSRITFPAGAHNQLLEGWRGYGRGLDFLLGRAGSGLGSVQGGLSRIEDAGSSPAERPVVAGTLVW